MPQINRTASIIFGDADIVVREPHPGRQPWDQEKAWEREYRNQVLKRIAQTLNRLGWTCAIPELSEREKKDDPYGIAENCRCNKRVCNKGDLKADLKLSGASITFQMFQNVNAPDRPDHDGRSQSDKEKHMPYLMRLEMERTRRRIRTYLCNIFSGYSFDEERIRKHEKKVRPGHLTALERIQLHYEDNCHFKGVDWDKRKAQSWMSSNLKSADGQMLEHSQTVWFTDYEGRWQRGTALYNINNMWWAVIGPYSYTNECCRELYVDPPEHPRIKANQVRRRKRLESLMSAAAATLDFKRAEVLKNILFPPGESLYMIWTDRHGGAYFGPSYSGYTTDTNQAGKYTRAELRPYLGSADENNFLRAVPVRKAA